MKSLVALRHHIVASWSANRIETEVSSQESEPIERVKPDAADPAAFEGGRQRPTSTKVAGKRELVLIHINEMRSGRRIESLQLDVAVQKLMTRGGYDEGQGGDA